MALLFYINIQHLFTELKEYLGSGSDNCVQDREIGGRGTRGDVTTQVGGLGATGARVTLSFVTVASVRATTAGLCLEPRLLAEQVAWAQGKHAHTSLFQGSRGRAEWEGELRQVAAPEAAAPVGRGTASLVMWDTVGCATNVGKTAAQCRARRGRTCCPIPPDCWAAKHCPRPPRACGPAPAVKQLRVPTRARAMAHSHWEEAATAETGLYLRVQ